MGADVKKKSNVPPLPAPTETESVLTQSVLTTPTELATDVSKPGDDKSSYSLPEDGTPVTIRTRGHKANKSQTSLLIEYFEAGKEGGGPSEQRKPSVRVRLTPSSKKGRSSGERGHIQITETRSTRKASLTRKAVTSSPSASAIHGDGETMSALSADVDDAHSYASATEESNVSRNPIDIEIDRSGRRRRPASPLIPAVDSKASYQPGTMSEISAIPTDSFLDGSGPTTSFKLSESKSSHSRSPSGVGDALAGAAAGLAVAAAADKLRSKDRERERDRVVLPKNRDKDRKSSKTSKGRTSSREEKYAEETKSSPRRKSGGGKVHTESVVSGADSSVLSSNLSPSYRSYDQHSVRSGTSKASSINNPKLLETVEDAIRRLILPELNALKREQSRHKERRSSTASSTTTASRDDYASDRRRSSGTDKNATTPRDSLKLKEKRDREARNDFDDSPSQSRISKGSLDELDEVDDTPTRHKSHDKSAAIAAGAMGAAALAAHELMKSPSDDKRTRRRRRAEIRSSRNGSEISGVSGVSGDYDDDHLAPVPPMPLMSEINPSEITRTSILSAESDRPHSASEELTPIQEVSRGQLSTDSSPTPTKKGPTLQALGAQHANVSHGDLRALPRKQMMEEDEYDDEYANGAVPQPPQPIHHDHHDDEYDEDVEYEQAGYAQPGLYDYYNTQDVPPPLKYVPYQPERRGLSPIPSVSGYTEGGSEAPNRDSKATQSASISSPEKSPRHDGGSVHSQNSIPSNVMSRDFGDDDRSLRSSGMDYRNTMYTEDSELDRVTSGQAVRAVGANPAFVHLSGIESNVASLVDGSMLDESVLTGESGHGGKEMLSPRRSVGTLEEEEEHQSRGHISPAKKSVESHHDEYIEEHQREESPLSASQHSHSNGTEYELDENGHKVPRSRGHQQSPTLSEAAIIGAGVGAAAAALKAQMARAQQAPVQEEVHETFVPAGVQRNKSFKERTMNGQMPGPEPKHSVDRLVDEHEAPKMGFSSFPLHDEPMPDAEWLEDDEESFVSRKEVDRERTPVPQHHEQYADHDMHVEEEQSLDHAQGGKNVDVAGAVAAGAAAAAALAATQGYHSRQASQDQADEFYRTSDDRKRDTIVTNPYEGTSPIVNLPGLSDDLLGQNAYHDHPVYGDTYMTRSPLGQAIDEGYISQGPKKTPDITPNKGKGVDFNLQPTTMGAVEDPFYTPNDRHLSGLSQGLGSPFYDAATGVGLERIESKDIIALMQHLMVRDAQRSARDTEILVTIVRAAAEMRNSFDDIKKMLADTEDVIITEVKENTDKTVQRAINGPRPYPGSAARSIQAASLGGTSTNDDIPAKKRNIFRRALKGLSAKGANDLGRIEDMMMQLLSEVDVLKTQTAHRSPSGGQHDHDAQSFDNIQPEVQYEQDRGYEPEGHAGTSTTSHASQSGHLSIPQSRAASGKLGYDHKVSAHRISTVPEANEDEYDHQQQTQGSTGNMAQTAQNDYLMTPAHDQRVSSVPLATPPQTAQAAQASLSNENTPRTEEAKKNKSGSRGSWFPKISRWSESTTTSVAQAFRRSGQSRKTDDEGHAFDPSTNIPTGPSRSGSLDNYSDNFQFSDPHTDKLHTGFSETDLHHAQDELQAMDLQPPQMPAGRKYVSMTPEDPKYKAHRNSLNLQHPQPRSGQTERFKAALESQAMGYDSPMSPRSAEWAGSSTSLHRFPRNANRDSYGSASDQVQQHQQHQQGQYWTSSPGAAGMTITSGPPLPPKEPLENSDINMQAGDMGMRATPPKNNRHSKLQKKNGSPLPHQSVESGYGTMTHGVPTASYISHSRDGGSPRLENRNLSGALGVPTRRPSGPRAMTPKSPGGSDDGSAAAEGRRKRDTFGTIASHETDTF